MKRSNLAAVFLALVLCGCTQYQKGLKELDPKTQERIAELVQGAGLANASTEQRLSIISNLVQSLHTLATQTNRIPTSITSNVIAQAAGASRSASVTSGQIRRASLIVGPPLEDQSKLIGDLLSDNEELRAAAEKLIAQKQTQEQEWAAQKAELERRLIEYGAKYEEERNKNIVKRIWHWATGLFGVAGAVAFFVFCPAIAIPLAGRFMGWLVEAVPKLAKFLGVVGKKAVDQMVVGLQKGKDALRKTNPEAAEIINNEMHKEMDAANRALVVEVKRSKLPI